LFLFDIRQGDESLNGVNHEDKWRKTVLVELKHQEKGEFFTVEESRGFFM